MAEGAAAESVVIESDDGDAEGDDEDAYAAFEAVEVEDEVIELSDLESIWQVQLSPASLP